MSDEVRRLAERRAYTRMVYQNFAMANCYGLSTEDQIRLDVNYQRAMADWMQAETDYQCAIADAARATRS
jgi:hypothetical protein